MEIPGPASFGRRVYIRLLRWRITHRHETKTAPPDTLPKEIWRRSNQFWTLVSIGIGSAFVAAGVFMPPQELARWALIFGWLCLSGAAWSAFHDIIRRSAYSLLATISFSVLLALGFLSLFKHYKKPDVSIVRGIISAPTSLKLAFTDGGEFNFTTTGRPQTASKIHTTPCNAWGSKNVPFDELDKLPEIRSNPKPLLAIKPIRWYYRSSSDSGSFTLLLQVSAKNLGPATSPKNWKFCMVTQGKAVYSAAEPVKPDDLSGSRFADKTPLALVGLEVDKGETVKGWLRFSIPKEFFYMMWTGGVECQDQHTGHRSGSYFQE